MAPGLGPLPAAVRDVDVVGPIARYVADLPPRARRQIKVALRIFDWLPFPWRFSRVSPEAREQFLRDMEQSGLPLHQDLLLFMKVVAGIGYGGDPLVRRAVGYEMRCEVRDAPADAAVAPALNDLVAPRGGEECDVAVVGSGAGGAVTAAILAEAGLDVLVLESGAYFDRRTYPDAPLEALAALYRDNGLTMCEGRPAIPLPIGRAVGGTTVVNSGTCFRARERVLAEWGRRFGVGWARGIDADYAEAEEILRVTPVDIERMGRNGQLVMEGAEALGLSHGPISRNAGACVQCSSCPAGCKLDAKRAMHVTYLPRAAAAGARIRSGVEARRIVFEGPRAAGLECLARTAGDSGAAREPFAVRARRAVVLAGGAIGTPELLLRSRAPDPGRQIGRHLHIHPAAWIGARFDEEVRGWDGVMQSYFVDEWEEMGLLMEATFTPLAFGAQWLPGTGREHQERVLAYGQLGSNGVHLSDASEGRVGLAGDGSVRITYDLNGDDARRLVFGIARAAEIFFAAGAHEVYSQVRGMPVLRRREVSRLEAADAPPSALRLEAFHPMGTARMSADPREGATGTDGSLHGAERLYVTDASLFPTSIGVNPMMTVIAVASRLARRLADRLS
jgi:choline dehydrogenase-like flavoprotein